MRAAAKKKTAIVRRNKTHAIVRREPPTLAESIEKVLIGGDLTTLNVEQRLDYYKKVCGSLGLNPLTRPFDYIAFQESENSAPRLTLYARRDCTDQLRKIHGITVTRVSRSAEDGMFIAEAEVRDRYGRTDSAIGVVPTTKWNKFAKPPCIQELTGRELANARMKAETKAKRRATLSICGLGFLDVSELDTVDYNEVTPGGRIIVENGKQREPAQISDAQIKKHDSIQLVEWKQGLYAITGNGLNIIRGELTEDEKKQFDIKYEGEIKGFTLPVSQAFTFKDMCERKGVETTFTEKV
jgi:hypothetical protein